MLQVYNIRSDINIKEREFFFPPLKSACFLRGNICMFSELLELMKFCYELIFSDPVENREVLQKHLLQLFIFWLNS